MTNPFRRERVASLLMDGEAWKQPLALRRLQSDRRTAHVVGDGMSGGQGGV